MDTDCAYTGCVDSSCAVVLATLHVPPRGLDSGYADLNTDHHSDSHRNANITVCMDTDPTVLLWARRMGIHFAENGYGELCNQGEFLQFVFWSDNSSRWHDIRHHRGGNHKHRQSEDVPAAQLFQPH